MAAVATRLVGMGKKAHKLSAKEARTKGERGAFARHLAALLAERSLDHTSFAAACVRSKIDVKEYTVRSWLRGDSLPETAILRGLGRVLELDDPRHILPE